MPVPVHFKLVVRGIFQDSEETWSFSTKYSRSVPGDQDAGLDDVNEAGITTAVQTLITNAGAFSAGVELQDWRMYEIGHDGRMQGNEPMLHAFAPGAVHGTGNLFTPTQLALCVTTIGPDKGPAHFGRFYLPPPFKQLSTGYRLTTTDATFYLQAATAFMKSVSDQIDLPLANSAEGVNVSPGPVGSTTGTLQKIDHLEVGRVFDTQQRRRRQLLEERVVGGQIDW